MVTSAPPLEVGLSQNLLSSKRCFLREGFPSKGIALKGIVLERLCLLLIEAVVSGLQRLLMTA